MTLQLRQHSEGRGSQANDTEIPAWVPVPVQRYLSHTEEGLPIREVARRAGCHASTVLRQIRKIEVRRDDPLVDRALCKLSARYLHDTPAMRVKETDTMSQLASTAGFEDDTAAMERQTLRILRRLCETGAVLAVAEGMETAVVAREAPDGSTAKTASVSAEFVSVMALNDWIECRAPGRISRYRITNAGRTHMAQLAEKTEADADDTASGNTSAGIRRSRYSIPESPVAALARRKGSDGAPFLCNDLVSAAERLREDFELGQMGPRVAQDWSAFLTAGSDSSARGPKSDAQSGPPAARERVAEALRYLGPGLGDVALRCCCYLEGLESAEKRMGWSARSGKIVLRIALQRLSQFYQSSGRDVLIG